MSPVKLALGHASRIFGMDGGRVSLPRLQPKSHLRTFLAALPLIAYRGLAGGMPVLLGLTIAYLWGLTELAAFTVANAMIAVALIVTDWGATRALPRNLALLPPGGAAEMLGSANTFRLSIVAAMLVAAGVAAWMGWVDRAVAAYAALLFPLCPLSVVATNALGERVVVGETRAVGTAAALGIGVFALLGLAVVAAGLGPRWLVAAYVAGKALDALVLVSRRWWVMALSSRSVMSTARAFWPFSSQMILGVLYSRMAVFTVEQMTTREDLGVFSVATALNSALLLIPVSMALLHFPELTRQSREGNAAGVRRIIIRYSITSAAGVAAGLVGLGMLARPLSRGLDIPQGSAAFVLTFAALALVSIVNTIFGFLMQARGQEALAARLSVVTLSLAIVYQVAALSAWGLWGIVPAVAGAELTTVVIFGCALLRRRRVGRTV